MNKLKPYVVRVSARRYTDWKKSSFFPVMGGLYGLMVGADYKRVFTISVGIKFDVEWSLKEEIRKILRDFMDFEECRQTIKASSPYIEVWRKEELYDFGHEPSKEEIAKVKRSLKWETEREIKDYLKETPMTSGLGRWMW